MTEIVQIDKLSKTFDKGRTTAVNDVSFSAPEGKIIGLLGPSGCGKTTTLRCIAGVERVDTGTIAIDGKIVSSDTIHVSPEDREIGMVFQNYAIWPDKTVYQNVVFPLKMASDLTRDQYEDRVMEVLELVQIPHLRDKPATDLSGGQQQRTALARALVHEPSLILLDEPLSNLDAKLRTEMRNEIQRIQYEVGTTMIYVTHDQEEAFYLSDEVIIMNKGKLIEQGDPRTLYTAPVSSFTRSFVGRWNHFGGEIQNGKLDLQSLDGGIDTSKLRSNGELQGDVDVYLRPTDVKILDDGTDVPGNDYVDVEGTVIAEGVLGELYEMTIQVGDVEITLQMSEFPDFTRGEQITIGIDPRQLQVYQASTV